MRQQHRAGRAFGSGRRPPDPDANLQALTAPPTLKWKRTRLAWSGGSRLPGASGAHRSHAAWRSVATTRVWAAAAESAAAADPSAEPRSMLAFYRQQGEHCGI